MFCLSTRFRSWGKRGQAKFKAKIELQLFKISCKKKYLWKVFFLQRCFFLWSIIAPWPIWPWISTPIIYFTRRMVQYMPTNYSVGPHRFPLVRKSRFEVHFPYCTIWCSNCYCTIVLHGRETAYPNWLQLRRGAIGWPLGSLNTRNSTRKSAKICHFRKIFPQNGALTDHKKNTFAKKNTFQRYFFCSWYAL